MTAPARVYSTPPQVAKELGVEPPKVLGWIASGELAAFNVANRTSKRPRWRISDEALSNFIAARSASPPRVAAPARRRQAAGNREFY